MKALDFFLKQVQKKKKYKINMSDAVSKIPFRFGAVKMR